jgi:anti-sigma regulatory factor (Ser/Thr protein kinase)
MARAANDALRTFILDRLDEHPRNIATVVVNRFGVSRVTANNYLRRLTQEGLIQAQGATRSRSYIALPLAVQEGEVAITASTEDDEVWRTSIRPFLLKEPQNVIDICAYGFTEMFNNIIDHSGSSTARYSVSIYANKVKMILADQGVGIFEKIKTDFSLYDRREAILQLSKGKLTSDPERHTGQGIFFSSRMFDAFSISSLDLSYIRIREDDNQWLLEVDTNESEIAGTSIMMEISRSTDRTPKQVFDEYADDDYRFSKTHVPLFLARIGEDQLVSRSQARRVLARVDKFSEVCLDFAGVKSIGQAFADEIFRVFSRQHAEVRIITFNVSDRVREMIDRVMRADI